MEFIKKDLDEWLDNVDYDFLNSSEYVPSEFALTFMNFIKLVNGEEGESHKTPPVHLRMMDKIISPSPYIANLCFRGSGKTTLFMEYFCLYLGVFNYLPDFGSVDGMIYLSDSMDNGVKSARKNIEFRYNNSEFLQEWIPDIKFTDAYIEMTSKTNSKLGIRMFGAKALALDTPLWLPEGGCITIGDCVIGDQILGANGKPTTITQKSQIFNKPMYELVMKDGRKLKVSEDHLNQVWIKKFVGKSNKHTYTEVTLTTKDLLEQDIFYVDSKGHNRPLIWIENCGPMEFIENKDILIDPYTVGVLLGDGSLNQKAAGNCPVVLIAHGADWPTYETEIPYTLGKPYVDKRNPTTIARTVQGINTYISAHDLSHHGDVKNIPYDFLYGSIEQRLALLQGLMDTDGSCSTDGKSFFSSNSKVLVEQVMFLVRSLGGQASWSSTGKSNHWKTYLRLDMPMYRLQRKLDRQRPPRDNRLPIVAINRIADEPSQCIAVDNDERQFIAGDVIRTHNTGIRGTKIFGKRPTLAILDDLVSDDDANSRAAMLAINDTVYKGVNHALDPTKRKVIFNGTPFNKEDILISAVESGTWDVNVWPVCKEFPCTREEFQPAWPDRFTYEYIEAQYTMAKNAGKLSAFNQELMLRITSEDEKLVQDDEIKWFSRQDLLQYKSSFNFYITTDFATTSKETADYSVISVWAYNHNGDWFWVDGIVERQTMDVTIDDLFRLAQEYPVQSAGIEITGQQGGFIAWLQKEMLTRNIWFNLASSSNTRQPGIRPTRDKLSRFNLVVPWFKAGKIFFPKELKQDSRIKEFIQEIKLATRYGIKGKDDCLDTISMLGFMNPWKPSQGSEGYSPVADDMWDTEFENQDRDGSNLQTYIV